MALVKETFLFRPTQIPGCQIWLDAADVNGNGTSVADGSSISTWTDKSGNGRNFTQTTAGNRPTYGTYLSAPGLLFTGASSQNLSNSYIQTGSGGRNTFIVFYDVNTSADQYGNPVLFYMANTNQSALGDWRAAYDGLNNYLGTDALAGAYLYRTVPNVTSMRTVRCIGLWGYQTGTGFNTAYVYGNGTQFTSLVSSFAATSPLNVTNTGVTMVGGGQTGYVSAVISEVIYYASDITTSQRQQIEGYLAWKWGLQASLPSNHPFRTYRPLSQVPIPTTVPQMPIGSKGLPVLLPSQISGCQLWLDAADINGNGTTVANGASISTWVDKSGNGRNATQSGGNRPTYVSSTRGVRFTTTSTQYMLLPDGTLPSGNNSYFIFFVFNPKSTPSVVYGLIYGGASAATTNGLIGCYVSGTNVQVTWHLNDLGTVSSKYAVGTTNIYETSYVSSGQRIQYTNGLVDGIDTPGTRNSGTGFNRIGSFYNSNNFPLDAEVFEILVYTTLTTAQRQQIEGYLAWKWGLVGSLPANHPYRRGIAPFPFVTVPRSVRTQFFSPTRISGCQFWIDATDPNGNGTTTSSGQAISNWKDKSSNGHNATPVVAATVSKQSINGNDTLYFNGTSMGYTYPSFTINTATHTFIFVAKPVSVTANSGYNYILAFQDSGGGSPYLVYPYYNSGVGGMKGYITSFDSSPIDFQNSTLVDNAIANTLTLSCAVIRSGNQQIFRNGTIQSSNTQTLTSTTSPYLYLGNYPSGSGFYFQGNLCEVLVYSTALTTFQRQQVEGYLAWKWGLQANLPSSHPFAKFPPPP